MNLTDGIVTGEHEEQEALRDALIRQIIQNGVVFTGILFAHQWRDPFSVVRAVSAFLILSVMSYWVMKMVSLILKVKGDWRFIFMSMYGRIPPALIWMFWVTVLVSLFLRPFFALVILAFTGIAVFHDLFLSEKVVLDVVVLAVEFTLRAVAGVVVLKDVPVSPWLLACTFLVSLVVSLGKRLNEVLVAEKEGIESRAERTGYSVKLLDQMLAVVTSSAFLTYVLYTISHRTLNLLGTHNLIYTIPFVLYGILRYLYLVNTKNMKHGSEIIILKDIPMLINILLWLASVVVVLSFR